MSTTNAFNTQSQDTTTGKQQQQPGYLEQAYNLASNAAATATTTASNALNSMTGTTGTTDPSTNYRNQQPHVGGVGDMGTKSDADVARLPEERANPNPYTSGGTSEALENPNISDPANIQQRLNARDPPNPYPEGNAGIGHSSDRQYRNLEDHVGGVGDLGTSSAADVVRLPEERANPNPLSSTTSNANPFRDTSTGAAAGFAGTRDRDRDTTDTTSTQSHGWKPDDKSWDTRNVVGTMHDPTQHGHSGGVTGSNIDTDHGLGMPHREDVQRGNRDEGSLGERNWAGATDFDSSRDAGFKADTRDQGVNERTQAPVGVNTTSSTRRDDRDEGTFGQQNVAGATDFHSGRDAGFKADTRDHGVTDRTRAPVGGLDTTTSTRREDRDETEEGYDEHDTTSPTGKSHPSKMDKLRGKVMIAKGKLTKDEEAIQQGQRLKTEGITVHPDDFANERRE